MKTPKHALRLSDVAYEKILHALFNAEVPMGGRVSQSDLTKLTGLLVGPVRDALKVLEADGLVVIHPRSGIELIQPSTELVRSTMQFRTMIERPAARRFALSVDPAELEQLTELHRALESDLQSMPPTRNAFDTLQEVEDTFHVTLVSSLRNELVDSAYRRLQLMGRIIRGNAIFYPPVAALSVQEHLQVLDACANRDPDAAEAAIAAHLTNAMNRNLGI